MNYEDLGRSVGELVAEKQAAYGDSFGKSHKILKVLFPDGIKPEQYMDVLTICRVVDNYDLVLEYLLSEGYSHKEATRIMVNLDEGFIQDLWKAAQKRFSSPKSIARAGAADVAATAIATTPANTTRPALPPQSAPIIRQVAAPVNLNPAAPFKKVRDIVRQLNPAKPTAGSLPQGKPGGSVVPASKPGAVTPSAKPASGMTNTSGGSSVATTTGSGQVSTTGANVRSPGGPLAKAGPVIDVQSRLTGAKSVQRLSPGQVTNMTVCIDNFSDITLQKNFFFGG